MVYHPGGIHLGFIVGVFNGEGPPVPLPNTEVKLTSAENTCLATDWEDRSMPTQRKDSPSAVFSLSLLSAEVSLRFFVTLIPLLTPGARILPLPWALFLYAAPSPCTR